MPRATEISITPSLPRALPEAARRKVSTAIESHLAAVEALTAFLDEAGGDSDLEDTGDAEPSLGGQDTMWDSHDQQVWAQGSTKDLEIDVHDQPHDPDPDEPSLAHTLDVNQLTAQRNLDSANLRLPKGFGNSAWLSADEDREVEFDGREDGHDREQVCEGEGADEHHNAEWRRGAL